MNWKLSDYANLAQILSIPVAFGVWYFTREQGAKFWKKWRVLIFGLLGIVALIGAGRWGCFDWLKHDARLPLWLFVLIGLLVLLFFWVVWLVGSHQRTRKPDSDRLSYKNDEIFGVVWIWTYCFGLIDIHSFVAFCPRDDCRCRLELRDNIECWRGYEMPVYHLCPRCGFRNNYEWTKSDLLKRVTVEVERRINTGVKGVKP